MRHATTVCRYSSWFLVLACLLTLTGCKKAAPPAPAAVAKARLPVAAPAATPRAVPSTEATQAAATDREPAVTSTDTAAQSAPARKQREPIYNPAADARADIEAARRRAAYEHKRVLVKFGGNWCGWCFKLHDVFKGNAEIAPIIHDEYELVLVDVQANPELLKELDPNNDNHSYPWLTVLDAEGKPLVNQNTGDLETGPQHDVQKVKSFLLEWKAPPADAEELLTAAIEEARAQNKRVLVHLGTPTCGWCRRLDRFLDDHQSLIALDYVDLPLDTVRMTQGQQIEARLRKDATGGVPWFAILDETGTTLVTSDGPGGNIGFPFEAPEIEHFVAMLNQTRRTLTEAQVAELERDLRAFAAERKARQAASR